MIEISTLSSCHQNILTPERGGKLENTISDVQYLLHFNAKTKFDFISSIYFIFVNISLQCIQKKFHWNLTSKHLQIFSSSSLSSPNKAWVLPRGGDLLQIKIGVWKVRQLERRPDLDFIFFSLHSPNNSQRLGAARTTLHWESTYSCLQGMECHD